LFLRRLRLIFRCGRLFVVIRKAIGGTVSNSNSINQDFISLVSVYCSKQKLVLCNAQVTNSKESEIPVIKQLIEALDLEGVTFTLDALHCQKKQQQ
jgi:hypothetical protein